MESGGCTARKQDDAEAQGAKLVTAAKCDSAPDSLACLRALTPDQVINAIPTKVDVAGAGTGYGPVADGDFLSASPLDIIAAGGHNHVPMIVGSNSDETSRTVPLATTATEAEYETAVSTLFPSLASSVLAMYPATDYASPWAAYVALTSDAKFICSARKALRALQDGQEDPIWRYTFTHGLENAPKLAGFGAWHGLDVLFLFDHLTINGYVPSTGEQSIVGVFGGAWSRLATKGDPNGAGLIAWPAYDDTDPYLAIDSTPSTGKGLRTKQCDFWDGILK
jgi:para-nitrobenzyl esterase